MKKSKASYKGLPGEGKAIISLKKSFCDNLNQSIGEDQSNHDAKLKELESELSTAVQSKNQLEDTVQIIDKYISELIKDTPALFRIKEALDSVVVPIARMQNNNKEIIRTLQSQLKETNDENKQLNNQKKESENTINQLKSKLKIQEEINANLQKDISNPKPVPKIPKLDLSRVKPKSMNYKPIIKPDKYAHNSDSEESAHNVQPMYKVPKLDLSRVVLSKHKPIVQPESESEENAPSIPKLDLRLLHGHMQYHDEFMSKQDEFSLSWRQQLEKEKRY